MAKQLRNKIADINKHKFVEATLIDAVGGLCAVKIGGKRGNGGVLRGIPFIGPAGEFGQKVYVDYSSGKPIVQIFGQPEEQVTTRRTIRARPVNAEPASEGGSSTSPTVADHTHDAIYLAGTSDPMWYDPTDAGFLAACTAAQDGDTITLPNGFFNGPVTLSSGVNLVGSGDTTVQYVLTTGGNQIIENVKFWQSIAGQQYCVNIPNTGADNVFFYDCQFYNGNGTQDIWLINMPHGGETQAEFWNCFFQIYASAHNGYAFYSSVAHGSPAQAWTKTYFCSYEIRCITSGTPLLWNSNCKIGIYSVSWGPTDLTPGANVFYLSGDRYTASATASGVSVVTTNFDGILSGSDSDVQTALETIDDLVIAGTASDISTNTAAFDGILSAADDTVQKALDTIDDIDLSTGTFNDIQWAFGGYIAAQADASQSFVIPRACTILSVKVYAKTPGTAGSTVIDVNKNGTSIFLSNPTLAFNDVDKLVTSIPNTTSIAENDVLTVDIDSVATGAADLVVQVHFSVNLGGEIDNSAIHDDVASEIYPLSEKTTPHNNDRLLVEDSEDNWAKKSMKISTLPFSSSTLGKEKIFTREGDIEASSGTIRLANHSGSNRIITAVYLDVNTAPTGAAIIVDIHKGGTTIFTNQAHRPQVAATAFAGNTTTIDVSAWNDGEYLTCDVDQIGSSIGGSDLTVTVKYLE